ncbi:MAG: AraC family transcriptional regulator [Hydrococcus sp. Prado102]|jgi:AraC-like DNA-binding protein|nr:AraC family transcriptional regulator [Hydrococcus sp. Prado102]
MICETAKVTVKAWQFRELLLERYAYTPGSVEPIPKHSHAEYQFALCFDWQGEYNYRGAWHQIPKGSLSIIHPGEVHAPSEKTYVPAPANYLMMSASSEIIQAVALELAEKPIEIPFFAEPFLLDTEIAQAYSHLHFLAEQSATELEQDSALLFLLTQLMTRHAQDRLQISPLKSARPAIMRVRDFIQAHFAENISLKQLSEIAQLSRFHLCRMFRHEIGIPPHTYQMQIRVDYAKRLINQGKSLTQIAAIAGFYDQSHFGRHFKRITGVSPNHYRRQSNNVLDEL